jgi:hypothetical protein
MRSQPSAGVRNHKRTERRLAYESRSKGKPPNNAMQLTRGDWSRVETSVVGNKVIVNHGEVVRPSQLIASVGLT